MNIIILTGNVKAKTHVIATTQTADMLTIILDTLSLIALIIAFYFLYKLFTNFIKPPHKPF